MLSKSCYIINDQKLDKLILLTPFYGDKEILKKTVYSVVNQLDENDIWIIVLDNGNIEEYADLKKFKQLILINNRGPKGAEIVGTLD